MSDDRKRRGLAFLEARRRDEVEQVIAGRSARADATPDVERELLVAAASLAAGEADRFLRAVRAAQLAGADLERIVDVLLLAAPIVGMGRISEAADIVREAAGLPSGEEDWTLAAMLSEIPDGAGREVSLGGRKIALLRKDGAVHAVQASCPHMRGPMAEGYLEPGTVTCPLHAWTFDLASGDCQGIPGVRLAVYPVRIEGNRVLVRL